MTRLYSQKTGNCYIENIHTEIPSDAVAISDEVFLTVIASPAPGKVRSHDSSGLPILVDRLPPSAEVLAVAERDWRDGEVAGSEWLVNRHRDEQDMQLSITLQAGQFAELLQYRQALRDWPQSELFPASEHRPVPPAWLADLTP